MGSRIDRDITSNEILQVLSLGPMDVATISKRLRISSKTILKYLWELYDSGDISVLRRVPLTFGSIDNGKSNNLFGDALKKIRVEAGMSMNALARAVGVSTTYICTLEGGRSVPASKATILKICEATGSNPEVLIAMKMRQRAKLDSRLYQNSLVAQSVQMLLAVGSELMSDDEFIIEMEKIGFVYEGRK